MIGEVLARIDVVVHGRHHMGVVVGVGEMFGDARATAEPPVTAREPPSQKSF